MMDYVSGRPCTNCESEPAKDNDLFCSDECRAEYEGTCEGHESLNGADMGATVFCDGRCTKAKRLREEAAELSRKSQESFDRCDTDGFLSQWAMDITAAEKRLKAKLIEKGNITDVVGLFRADGTLIENARYVETRYGMAWVYENESGTHWFNPSRAKSAKRRYETNLRKGYYVGRIMVNADACIVGSGTGLSGAATARPAIVPIKNRDGSFQIISEIDNGHNMDKIHPDLARAGCERPEMHDDDIEMFDYCAWCGVRYLQTVL